MYASTSGPYPPEQERTSHTKEFRVLGSGLNWVYNPLGFQACIFSGHHLGSEAFS